MTSWTIDLEKGNKVKSQGHVQIADYMFFYSYFIGLMCVLESFNDSTPI